MSLKVPLREKDGGWSHRLAGELRSEFGSAQCGDWEVSVRARQMLGSAKVLAVGRFGGDGAGR